MNNVGLNCMGPLIVGFFFSKYIGKIFRDLLKKEKTDEPCSLEIAKKLRKS